MKFYFISDNSFFIDGLKKALTSHLFDESSVYINVNHDHIKIHPQKDDVVVIAVENLNARRKILQTPEIALSKLAIMGTTKTRIMLRGIFLPCFLSGKMTKDDLISALIFMKKNKFKLHQLSTREAEVFFYLGAGFSHDEVAEIMGMQSKYIYALRRKVNISLGLLECNCATGILLCRDIAEMMTYSKTRFIPNQFTFGTNIAFF